MTQQASVQPQNIKPIAHEYILVIPRDILFAHHQAWEGMNTTDFQSFIDIVHSSKEFILRAPAETNHAYKQIIPYLIFTHNKKIFVMQRRQEASEQRLANKLSIGIGGHIREEDIQGTDLASWAEREFHEEVSFDGKIMIEPVGILNDDSNDVGKVHLGFVYLVHGSHEHITIKDEHKSGQLYSLEECEEMFARMEGWSQESFKAIKEKLA